MYAVRELSVWLFCLTQLDLGLIRSQVTTLSNPRAGICHRFTVNDLGSTEELRQEGLVSSAHLEGDAAPSDAPAIQILDYHVVCESVGLRKNTTSSVSVVVKYLYQIAPREPVENRVAQFQFECLRSQASPGYFGEPIGWQRSASFSANFRTELETRCGYCVDPGTVVIENTDDVTHCQCAYNDTGLSHVASIGINMVCAH